MDINGLSKISRVNLVNPNQTLNCNRDETIKSCIVLGQRLRIQISNQNEQITAKLNDIAKHIHDKFNQPTNEFNLATYTLDHQPITIQDLDQYLSELKQSSVPNFDQQITNICNFLKCCVLLSIIEAQDETKINYFNQTNQSNLLSVFCANTSNINHVAPIEQNKLEKLIEGKSILFEVCEKKALIEYYSQKDDRGMVINPGEAIKLLGQCSTLFDGSTFKSLVKSLIDNCCGNNRQGNVSNPKHAQELIATYQTLFDKTTIRSWVITLYENSSKIGASGYVRCVSDAKNILSQYPNLFDKNTFHNNVKTLIENCSKIVHFDTMMNASDAIALLKNYKSLFDKKTLTGLASTLFNNLNSLDHNGKVRHPNLAVKLLDDNKDLFENHTFTEMIKLVIENSSHINDSFCVGLLTKYKELLVTQERDFYQQKLLLLFNNNNFYYTTQQLLTHHGDNIPQDVIINRYRTTDSIAIINEIRGYVQGVGVHRRINLPPRNDLVVNGRPLEGIAFEIHNYTNGIESFILEILRSILKESDTTVADFNIGNLRNKFKLLEPQQERLCANALDNILEMSPYNTRLSEALPLLAAFLNLDSSLWEDNKEDANGRWQLWLLQSFYEAATAYPGPNGLSCVKGIYERLFTGFRKMHPSTDILFSYKEKIRNQIQDILKSEDLVQKVITRLKAKKIRPDDERLNSKLLIIYLDLLPAFMRDAAKNSDEWKKLSELPETCKLIDSYFEANQEFNRDDPFINGSINSIEDIEYDENRSLKQYIMDSLV